MACSAASMRASILFKCVIALRTWSENGQQPQGVQAMAFALVRV